MMFDFLQNEKGLRGFNIDAREERAFLDVMAFCEHSQGVIFLNALRTHHQYTGSLPTE
jgi:hypothetical protein